MMPSRSSRPSGRGSPASASPGNGGLGQGALKNLAARHGIRPRRSLGQNFLIDPNTARLIAELAGVGPGDHVLEVGAGLGSLTVVLAEAGADVLAVEFDRALIGALRQAVGNLPSVRLVVLNAMKADWPALLGRRHRWKMVSDLPYNVGVPLLLGMLEAGLPVDLYLVMLQREVGERLARGPGGDAYGAVSVKVAYHAHAEILRSVPPSVFWPRPKVDSVLVRLSPLAEPLVDVPRDALFRVVDEGFAQRRKTMRNALRRLGLSLTEAGEALRRCGFDPDVRAEEISLAGFADITREVADLERN